MSRPASLPPTSIRLPMRRAIRLRLAALKGTGIYEIGQLEDALRWLNGAEIQRDARVEIVTRKGRWQYRLHMGSLGYSCSPSPLITIEA